MVKSINSPKLALKIETLTWVGQDPEAVLPKNIIRANIIKGVNPEREVPVAIKITKIRTDLNELIKLKKEAQNLGK